MAVVEVCGLLSFKRLPSTWLFGGTGLPVSKGAVVGMRVVSGATFRVALARMSTAAADADLKLIDPATSVTSPTIDTINQGMYDSRKRRRDMSRRRSSICLRMRNSAVSCFACGR